MTSNDCSFIDVADENLDHRAPDVFPAGTFFGDDDLPLPPGTFHVGGTLETGLPLFTEFDDPGEDEDDTLPLRAEKPAEVSMAS